MARSPETRNTAQPGPEDPPADAARARIVVRIVDVRGLYRPGAPDSSPRPAGTTRAAGQVPGYKSSDNQGRIYLNRDLDGRWTSNTQLIEVTAEITVTGGQLPRDARIRWSVRDPDDPFNERPEVDPSWGPTLDTNDYDGAGNYVAPAADDNEGTRDGAPSWEVVEGYPLSDTTDQSTKTAIAGTRSRVRHHTTDVAGDNLILRVDLDTASPVDVEGDETGVMTLWHRIDVEVVRMESALPLPVEEVPPHFEPAFVQLDFAEERTIADQRYMAPDRDTVGESSSRFVDVVFSHELDPGWFCLISALEPYPLLEARSQVLFRGTVAIQDRGEAERRVETIDIPGSHPDADLCVFRWDDQVVSFQVATATVLEGPVTRLVLAPHDVQDRFTAGDGSVAHAYAYRLFFFPRARRRGAEWQPPGYGMPADVEVEVRSPGAFYTAGISPTIDLGNKRYFAGRTLLFSHHRAWWRPDDGQPQPGSREGLLRTIVHELVHAFGMPHKCGYFDYRTPRQTTCAMNYGPNWMINAEEQLIPGTSGRVGNDMCGRHLKEVRRVHLQNNGGLRWK